MSENNDPKVQLEFILSHSKERYQQYRHLDTMRERYFGIWLGLLTALTAGSLVYLGTNQDGPFWPFGVGFMVIGVLGGLFTLMGIQIRSSQIREAVYLIALRWEMVKSANARGLLNKLLRLSNWTNLCTALRVSNFHSSSVWLILTMGFLSSTALGVGISITASFSLVISIVLTLVLVLIAEVFISLYLLLLNSRLQNDIYRSAKEIHGEDFNVEEFLKWAQNRDTN